MIGSTFRLLVLWLVLAALYALLAGEISVGEMFAGLLATGIAVIYAIALHRSRLRIMTFHAPWLLVLGGPLAALAPDTWRVGRVLLRSLWRRPNGAVGMLSRQPFHEGDSDPHNAGRRGLVTLGLSLAPNGYVLDIKPDAIWLHRLAQAKPNPNRDWPT